MDSATSGSSTLVVAISGFLLIAAVGDDGGHGIFHPIADAARAQVVQQQQLDIERRAVGFAVADAGGGVPTFLDAVQQVLVIKKKSFEAAGDQNPQRGHGQVRLAGAGIADQQQARAGRPREIRG